MHPGEYRFPGDEHGTAVAFKIFRGSPDAKLYKQITDEAQVGAKVGRHPNLVELHGVLEVDDERVALVTAVRAQPRPPFFCCADAPCIIVRRAP